MTGFLLILAGTATAGVIAIWLAIVVVFWVDKKK